MSLTTRNPYTQLSGFSRGFPIPRGTWAAGRTIGKHVKKWWDSKKTKTARATQKNNKRKRKQRYTPVEMEGTGGSITKMHYGVHSPFLPKSVRDTLAPYFYSTNGAQQSNAAIGVQKSVVPLTLADGPDLVTMCGKYVGGGVINRVLLEKVRGTILISNAMIANACITIYDCISRKDSGTVAYGPDAAWTTGVTDESGSTYAIFGAQPFDSELFTQYWTVRSTEKIVLGQGGVHKHTVQWEPNRLLNYEYVYNNTGYIAGLTTATMIVFHGMPANDSVTSTQVGLGAATLDIVYGYEYEFRFPANNSTKIFQTNNIRNNFTIAEEVISTGAGIPETNVVA